MTGNNTALLFIIFLSFSLFIVVEVLHYKERKDLYNRIMADDYREYTMAEKKPPKMRRSRHEILRLRQRGIETRSDNP